MTEAQQPGLRASPGAERGRAPLPLPGKPRLSISPSLLVPDRGGVHVIRRRPLYGVPFAAPAAVLSLWFQTPGPQRSPVCRAARGTLLV